MSEPVLTSHDKQIDTIQSCFARRVVTQSHCRFLYPVRPGPPAQPFPPLKKFLRVLAHKSASAAGAGGAGAGVSAPAEHFSAFLFPAAGATMIPRKIRRQLFSSV